MSAHLVNVEIFKKGKVAEFFSFFHRSIQALIFLLFYLNGEPRNHQ